MDLLLHPVGDLEPAEDPNSSTCRQNRADRALELIHAIQALGCRRLETVTFTTLGVCRDVPVIAFDGIRFTYAYPAEHLGVAVLVPCCCHGCGAECPIEVWSGADVELVHGAEWAHDCQPSRPQTFNERARALTDHIGRGTRTEEAPHV